MPPNINIANTGGVLSPNQIGMSANQRRLYDRLRMMGIQDAVARQLAVAVAKSAGPRGFDLAKAAMEQGQECKGYHQAFVEQAKAQMHPAFFDMLHRKARAVAGGSASGASRRATRTAESPDEFPLVADDDVIEAKISKADGVTPPQGVRSACKRGLELMAEHGGPGLTDGAKARARSMAAGEAVSPDNIKRMRSFFARHDSYDKEANPPSPGYVAWMLWGGDAGKSWAESQAEKLEKKQKPLGAAYARAKAKTKDKKKQRRIANQYLREQGHSPVGKAAQFNEGDHPRDESGRFSNGGGATQSGRTAESAGVRTTHVLEGAAPAGISAHQHLRDAQGSIAKGNEAADRGDLKAASEHYIAAQQSTFHANALAKAGSNATTGKAVRSSKESKAEQERLNAQVKVHSAASARANAAGDSAKGYAHTLAAGAHAQLAGAMKRVGQAKLADLSLAKAMAALAFAKGGPGSGPKGGGTAVDEHRKAAAESMNKVIEAMRAGDRAGAAMHRAAANKAHSKALDAIMRGEAEKVAKGLGPLVQEMVATTDEAPPKKKKKNPKRVGVSLDTKIVKAEETPWQRLVYSTVYAPDELDTDGDFMDPATIEKAAHEAMANGIYINHEHAGDPVGAHVVESYIAPCDMNLGAPGGESLNVTKGTWMMALKVTDPDIWQGVLDGTYGGFSLEGSALAEMASQA